MGGIIVVRWETSETSNRGKIPEVAKKIRRKFSKDFLPHMHRFSGRPCDKRWVSNRYHLILCAFLCQRQNNVCDVQHRV